MKKKDLFLLLLFLPNIVLSQWKWLSPKPQGNTMSVSWIFNSNSAIFGGGAGTVMKTTDGGNSWIVRHYISGDSAYPQIDDMFFLNENIGWAVGSGFLVKTTDGGNTWENKSPDTLSGCQSVFFLNENIGWVSGNNSIIKTIDGGQSWNLINTQYGGSDIVFLNSQVGFTNRYNPTSGIAKSVDGGLTWTLTETQDGIGKILMYDVLVGWGYRSGSIFRTTNGGQTWLRKYLENIDMFTEDGLNLYAINTRGNLSKSVDGGANWTTVIPASDTNYFQYATFYDTSLIWSAVYSKIMKSNNQGRNWTTKAGTDISSFYGIDFVKRNIGWVVGYSGDGGFIMKTTNGGNSWETQLSLTNSNFTNISMLDENTGVAIGWGGLIRKTTDGGINWVNKNHPSKFSLNKIKFYDENFGIIVGDSGIILKTTNGGDRWTAQYINTKMNLHSVSIVNQSLLFCAGNKSQTDTINFFRSTDGGETWLTLQTLSLYYCESIHFFDSLNGIAVGLGKNIFRTTDGGNTWTTENIIDAYAGLHIMYFLNNHIGWIVNNMGQIFKTIDGGVTWKNEPSMTNNQLFDITAIDDSTCWVSGDNTILGNTTDAGTTIINDGIHNNNVVGNFTLKQNYPNPFNPSTQISFTLPTHSFVTLKVYDLLGREISTLLNSKMEAGEHVVNWNASNRESGVYVYRIVTEKYVETRKMLLVR